MKIPRRSDKLREPEGEEPKEPGYIRKHSNAIVGWAIALGILVAILAVTIFYVGGLETNHAQIDQKLQNQLTAAGYTLQHAPWHSVDCGNTVRVTASIFVESLAPGNKMIIVAGEAQDGATDYYQVNGASCVQTWVDGYTSL